MADTITAEEKTLLAEIEAKFGGAWHQTKSDNLEAFLEAMGLNFVLRKVAKQAKPTMKIAVDGADIKVDIVLPIKTEKSVLKLNKEVDVENSQGKYKATTSYKDGKLIVNSVPSPGNKSKGIDLTREINDDGELVATFSVHGTDVVCTRIFSKAK